MSQPLAEVGAALRAIADQYPWDPLSLTVPIDRHWRRVDLDGHSFHVCLTRTNAPTAQFYLLSIGEPAHLPQHTVRAVVNGLLPGATELERTRLSRKYVLRIEGQGS